LVRGASASTVWVASEAARARVHGCDELELRRVQVLALSAIHSNMAGFERLAQLI
jgi:hypothetical protein